MHCLQKRCPHAEACTGSRGTHRHTEHRKSSSCFSSRKVSVSKPAASSFIDGKVDIARRELNGAPPATAPVDEARQSERNAPCRRDQVAKEAAREGTRRPVPCCPASHTAMP